MHSTKKRKPELLNIKDTGLHKEDDTSGTRLYRIFSEIYGFLYAVNLILSLTTHFKYHAYVQGSNSSKTRVSNRNSVARNRAQLLLNCAKLWEIVRNCEEFTRLAIARK